MFKWMWHKFTFLNLSLWIKLLVTNSEMSFYKHSKHTCLNKVLLFYWIKMPHLDSIAECQAVTFISIDLSSLELTITKDIGIILCHTSLFVFIGNVYFYGKDMFLGHTEYLYSQGPKWISLLIFIVSVLWLSLLTFAYFQKK